MNKPASLYPKPEPMNVDPKLVYLGSGLSGILFFIIGFTFQNVGVI